MHKNWNQRVSEFEDNLWAYLYTRGKMHLNSSLICVEKWGSVSGGSWRFHSKSSSCFFFNIKYICIYNTRLRFLILVINCRNAAVRVFVIQLFRPTLSLYNLIPFWKVTETFSWIWSFCYRSEREATVTFVAVSEVYTKMTTSQAHPSLHPTGLKS